MYIPKDDPEADAKLSKAELKIRRERERRAARKRVKETIEGWEKVFLGETGRPYFWVGQIKKEKDWMEKSTPPELCQAAEDSRPKREDNANGSS
jgi:hypothetical protein